MHTSLINVSEIESVHWVLWGWTVIWQSLLNWKIKQVNMLFLIKNKPSFDLVILGPKPQTSVIASFHWFLCISDSATKWYWRFFIFKQNGYLKPFWKCFSNFLSVSNIPKQSFKFRGSFREVAQSAFLKYSSVSSDHNRKYLLYH